MSMSMNFDLFKESVIQILQENLGGEYKIYSDNMLKNNGVELTGIIIQKSGQNASPTIYINELFEEYQRGISLRKITETILQIHKQSCYEQFVDLHKFRSYEEAKEQIVFKLIHKEKNEKLLEKVPYRIFHNLAIVFYYVVNEPPFYGKASILITNKHLEYWKVDEEEFCRNAICNTPRILPPQIQNIEDVMKGLLKNEGTKDEMVEQLMTGLKKEIAGVDKIPMYVLSNTQKLQGAACMLYPEVIRNFAKAFHSNVYILPSSIHEVILLPEDECYRKEELLTMVTEINATQVDRCEVLADAVYFFDLEKNEILQLFQ